MEEITMFILAGCPYCRKALSWMEELKKENPKYTNIPIKIIDESKEADLANQYDYYYVPSYYIGNEKLHEGAVKKEIIQNIFEKALEE
ncbi:MAG: glutaredoxin [Clostridiales bacterium]|uniref:thioredoxin family protein n=1 Tax=Clostridium sp. N3C TaxID=1776758 RepID=UPI0009431600|nr:thioredoxin family protein [Clostridium sp. N3C]NLZ48038.1 glutaredoxin [Clostridiales bacterium]